MLERRRGQSVGAQGGMVVRMQPAAHTQISMPELEDGEQKHSVA